MYIELIGLDNLHIFISILAAHSVLFLYVVINFLIATFMDPGRFPKGIPYPNKNHQLQRLFPNNEINELITHLVDITHGLEENNKIISNNQSTTYKNVLINDINVRMKWCTTCQFYRPPRSSHCGVCNACIDTMDHHCPWVCNCIARRNYKYFLQFLVSLTIHMCIILGLAVTLVLHNKENLTHIPVICSFVLIVIVSVLILPIGGLTVFHLVLVSRGRTTNEQVTGKFRTGVNPFDAGCSHNWQQTLCTPAPLSFVKFKRRKQRERENYQTQLLIAKYKMFRQSSGNSSSNNADSIKTATNKLANNSTNSIIYTTKQQAALAATANNNRELSSLIKKSTLKPLREDEVDETDETSQPHAFPTKFDPVQQQQPISTAQQPIRKKPHKSIPNGDPDYVYDNAADDERVWIDRRPPSQSNQTSKANKANLYKNNANFVMAAVNNNTNLNSHLQNGSYRAMDKNVGTNLEQQLLSRNHHKQSAASSSSSSSNSRLKYQIDEASDLIIKPMSADSTNQRARPPAQSQNKQPRHVSTKHIVLSNNSPAIDDNFTVIDVRPTSGGGQQRNGNGYTVGSEVLGNGRSAGKSAAKSRPGSGGGGQHKKIVDRNGSGGGGGLILMQPQQTNPGVHAKLSSRNGEARASGQHVVKKSRHGGAGNGHGGHVIDNEFDSYEITV
jgi:palmitoyltransferase